MRTLAIVQARMGSSRMPGKVLKLVAGKPVLWHVIHRLRLCREIDDIVIATTLHAFDDPLVSFAQEQGVLITRGSEDNVLERYMLAVRTHDADLIVRVTGDAPLIDPKLIDTMLAAIKHEHADICHGHLHGAHEGKKVIHEGFTPISKRALEQLFKNGGHDPAVREHVTVKIQDYVEDLRTAHIDLDNAHIFNDARISIDTPSDLEFMNTVYDRLGANPGEADITDVVRLLRKAPELLAINMHVHQKSADEISHQVIIRCDGGVDMGLGHVMRCLSLAQALRDQFATGVRFVIKAPRCTDDFAAKRLIEAHHFIPDVIAHDDSEAEYLDTLLDKGKFDGIIFDVRTDLKPEFIANIRRSGMLTACIDDPSDRRLACDLGFYPPVPQVKNMSWHGFEGTLYCGWEWLLLNPSFYRSPSPYMSTSNIRILLSMGGANPDGMIHTALNALSQMPSIPSLDIHIVLGQAFQDIAAVERQLKTLNLNASLHINVEDMASLMVGMDMAVASFGVTAYELAASGIPTVLLSLSQDHAEAAQALVDAGVAISIGLHSEIDAPRLAAHVNELMQNHSKRLRMAHNARTINLKSGAHNIAREIKNALIQQATQS